jgi:hypothetical protein
MPKIGPSRNKKSPSLEAVTFFALFLCRRRMKLKIILCPYDCKTVHRVRGHGGIMFTVKKMILVLVLMAQSTAMAWGVLGHQSVALIAEAYLDPQVKEKVSQLLDGKRLVDVAMEADFLRDRHDYSPLKNYHFQNIDHYYFEPYRKQVLLGQKNPRRYQFGAVEGILKAQSELADSDSHEVKKAFAVKLLTHFIADLHQPLHTGLKKQFGGNGESLRWNGERVNLHQVWDSEIVGESLKQKVSGSRGQSWQYAKVVIAREHRREDSEAKMIDPETWFLESLSVQKQAIMTFRGKSEKAYSQWALPIIDRRIYLAGRRLAEVLNQSLKDSNKNLTDFARLKMWLESQFPGWIDRVTWKR